jgi:hypothetical protein
MDASRKLLIGTRKGLLSFERAGNPPGDWSLTGQSHLGIPARDAMRDGRTGTLWAALDHGHWSQKPQRSRDEGRTWQEMPAPHYTPTAPR